MRWLRGLGSALTLALLLIGAPFALLNWGWYPQLSAAELLGPDDGSLLFGLITAIGWLAWAAFGLATVVEAVRLLVGRPFVRLPGLVVVQQLSAGLLLAVLALATTASTPRATEPSLAQPLAPLPASPAEAQESLPEADASSYQVQPGDDLWSVSETLLGDGRHWRELAAANPSLLADPVQELRAGTRLAMPSGLTVDSHAAATPDPRNAAPRRDTSIVVERGDTLSELALEHLGAASRWPKIAAANRGLISDPDHIEVGWRLRIPGAKATPPAQEAPDQDGRRGPAGPVAPSRLDPPTARHEAPPPVAPEQPTGTPAPGPVAEAPVEAESAVSPSPIGLIGPVGTLAAAVIIGAVETRRALRLRERPRGRRLIDADPAAARLRVALGTVQRPDRIVALDRALRHLGERLAAAGRPLPPLSRIELDDRALAFEWTQPAGAPPEGFVGDPDCWQIGVAKAIELGPSEHPCPYPCVVSVGTAADGRTILVNAEQSRVLGVAADDAELAGSALLAMGIELACAPWSAEAQVVAAGTGSELLALSGGERVRRAPDLRSAISDAVSLAAERRKALSGTGLSELRADPDRADAVAPLVLVLGEELSPLELARLEHALDGDPCGVVALLPTGSGVSANWQVHRNRDALSGRLDGLAAGLTPHTVPSSLAKDLAGLLAGADSPATEPAWWAGAANVHPLPKRAEEPVDIVRVITDSEPRLLLIGPTDLVGARGEQPTRARQQLIELCAWILEHPRSTATQMAAGLGIAEGTRRSNLSRLRSWLGTSPEGQAYLPEAYVGRIELHPGVSSDWHQLQTLLAAGLDRLPDTSLVAALELVRGAPLADAAPGQWHWAEELRTDIASALRDTALVLTERALARRDFDQARWAAARALSVAPADELLMAARIRTEHLAGATSEVNRLVTQVTRQARQLGVDLLPETVELCQQVIEGSIRARWA
ncbi:LysM domain-containing protein [Propionicimonas paludicola]|uniref:LysM domain-containing protein n=1 Tax=Propionicimonas paludicola TaxID=185243 RepID=A0A2A9CXG8_9ACTN|nr:LysM peptidoglycan-binding domain-containing protein [Propionicimonas paludicola]PFG18320.1 LysM domain-containing protein [Propionicimonas paludicola]